VPSLALPLSELAVGEQASMAISNIWRMFSSNSTFDKLARVRPEARDAETNPYIEGLCVLSCLLIIFASPPADLNDRLAVAPSPVWPTAICLTA
jgi:hypothetical protein